MKKLKRAAIIGSILLGGCAPLKKADALPRKTRLPYPMKIKGQDSAGIGMQRNKIMSGKTTYELHGKDLLVIMQENSKVINLEKVFRESGVIPELAQMQVDGFPKSMKKQGELLYIYSPCAKGIAVISPGSSESTFIEVPKEARELNDVRLKARNGIVALTGPGADFLIIIGLGDLLKNEIYPVKMRLDNLFVVKRKYLIDPKVEIRGKQVYISDDSLGRGKTHCYQVHNGIAIPITIEYP